MSKISLVFIIIIVYLLCFVVVKYKNYKYTKITENSTAKLLRYLDKYYITNKAYTIFAIISYFFFNSLLLLYLRLKIIKNNNNNMVYPIQEELLQINFNNMFDIISYLCLFIISLILIKTLLDLLFFDEIIKLHLYLKSKSYYYYLTAIFTDHYIMDFLGKLALFFHNIAKLHPLSDLEDTYDVHDFDIYRDIYENDKIQRLSTLFVNLARKNIVVLFLFKVLRDLFYWFYTHMHFHDFGRYIPYIIIFCFVFNDFLHLQLYYIPYIIIPFFIITIILKVMDFLTFRDVMIEHHLSDYFYKSSIHYSIQRKYLKNNIEIIIENINKLEENRHLKYSIQNGSLYEYILNNFKMVNEKEKELHANLKNMYRRYYIIGLSIIITIYIIIKRSNYSIKIEAFSNEISIVWLLIPLISMIIYASINTFKSDIQREYHDDIDFTSYKYNSRYNKVFWGLIILQIYVYYILLIKGYLIISNDQQLWYGFGINITRHYSLEYKVKIFNNQLDHIMKKYDIKGQHLENIKLFIEQLNMKEFITEKTTIKDINMFIEDLLQNYSKILIRMLKKYERLKTTKAIMDCMSNIINSICLWSFATKYLGALYLVINPDSSEMRILLRTLIILINRFK